jgi:hypothetical protein
VQILSQEVDLFCDKGKKSLSDRRRERTAPTSRDAKSFFESLVQKVMSIEMMQKDHKDWQWATTTF